MNIKEIDIKNNWFREISRLVAANGAVAIRTSFNCVREYSWWGDERVGGHIAYIIGEDVLNYHVVDNPYNLTNLDEIRMKSNPSIVLIPKSHFQKAFENKCRVVLVTFHDVPVSEGNYFSYIKGIIEKMTKIYYKKLYGCGFYVGKDALLHMLQDCEKRYEKMFDSFYNYERAVSRRLILKRCLNICASNVKNRMEIMKYLNQSIKCWSTLKTMSDEWFFYRKEVTCRAEPEIRKVIEIEEKLMEQLESVATYI